ncbi:MAG: 16S rRNA (guanine(527)-N(7))-methyltransferase RsmG [Janthinobacterium lividum]
MKLPGVSRETMDRLETYATLLARWNRRINLVAANDVPRLWPRHIEDALQLMPFIPPGIDALTDLGSGGGIPGLVLAIASGLPVTLVEADQRKCAFLREAARTVQARATIVASRIEDATLPKAMLITARALAPLERLLGLAAPHLAPGGTCVFLKGATVQDELTMARRQWHMQASLSPSRTDAQGAILVVTNLERA